MKALKEIKKAYPDVTPDEIERRVANFKARFPNATVTAMAMAKNWGLCDKPAVRVVPAWRLIPSLEAVIAEHPANPESLAYSSDRVTDEQRRELRFFREMLKDARRRNTLEQTTDFLAGGDK